MDVLAVASLVLGIASVAALVLPIPPGFVAPLAIAGAVTGFAARRSSRSRIAIAGASLASLALLYYVIGFVLFALFT